MKFTGAFDKAADLLAKSPAQEWEVMALETDTLSLAIKGQEVDKFQQASTMGLCLRLAVEGKLGFTYVIGADPDELAPAVERALASAKASDLTQEAGFAPPAEMQACQVYDPALAAEPIEAKKERALSLARAALDADPKVVHVHPAEVGEAVTSLALRNSHGLDLTSRSTLISAGVVAMAGQGNEQEVAYDGHTARFVDEIDVVKIGRRTGRRAAAYLGGSPMADGVYDVVLEHRVATELMSILASSLSGDSLIKGRSLFKGKQDQKVVSDLVSIVDDGLYPRGLGTGPFDDEGTPQQRTVLIDGGVLRSFVFDRLWGAAAGKKSTGNAVRPSLKAPPGVGFTNLHIVPGGGSLEELAKDVAKGMLITEIMGAHTTDPVSGEFSLGASGFLIEGGKIARPVKSMAMAGQLTELFGRVEKAGADLRFFGKNASPSLLISGLSLSGPGDS